MQEMIAFIATKRLIVQGVLKQLLQQLGLIMLSESYFFTLKKDSHAQLFSQRLIQY